MSAMNLKIGTVRNDCAGFNSIAEFAKLTHELWLDSVCFDFHGCSFFEANMTAPLYVMIARLRDGLNDVSVKNISPTIENILKKNHFLEQFNIKRRPDTNQTTLPFKIFKRQAEEQFNDYLELYMHGKGIPEMSSALTKRFLQSLLEIFLNASIHSNSTAGIFTCGQFFPTKHRLDFAIADAGVGIRENVRTYLDNPKINSTSAIKWALREGNTTKTGRQPGGLGLKLIKDFIQLNKGKLQIVSRFGYYEFTANGDSFTQMKHDFPGTCVNIEINTQDTSSYCLKSELNNNNIF